MPGLQETECNRSATEQAASARSFLCMV